MRRRRGRVPPPPRPTPAGPLSAGLVTVVAADTAVGAVPGAAAGQGRPGAPDAAWVHVGADGAITAFTGKVEAGQGTRTALALLVAEALAVASASVRLLRGRTAVSPFGTGSC